MASPEMKTVFYYEHTSYSEQPILLHLCDDCNIRFVVRNKGIHTGPGIFKDEASARKYLKNLLECAEMLGKTEHSFMDNISLTEKSIIVTRHEVKV